MDDTVMMTMMTNNGALNFQFGLIKLPLTHTHMQMCAAAT